VPNSGVLAAVIGPLPVAAEAEEATGQTGDPAPEAEESAPDPAQPRDQAV
jgi:hypothetical protein